VAVAGLVAGDELVEVRARRPPRLEGEVLVGAEVVQGSRPFAPRIPDNRQVDRRDERRAGMSRVGTADDGSFDREFWGRVPPAERLALVWDMALESLEWRGQSASQSRLQRSVCRVERGAR
jgi:hypothetical protein